MRGLRTALRSTSEFSFERRTFRASRFSWMSRCFHLPRSELQTVVMCQLGWTDRIMLCLSTLGCSSMSESSDSSSISHFE